MGFLPATRERDIEAEGTIREEKGAVYRDIGITEKAVSPLEVGEYEKYIIRTFPSTTQITPAQISVILEIEGTKEPYRWEKEPPLELQRRETFNEIRYGEQIIKLKSPINVEWMLSEEGYSFYYEPLDISVSAPTLDECEEDFQEEFYVLYKVYAKEVDEKLTEGARELKRRILNLVLVEP
jgi:hypothetical protein